MKDFIKIGKGSRAFYTFPVLSVGGQYISFNRASEHLFEGLSRVSFFSNGNQIVLRFGDNEDYRITRMGHRSLNRSVTSVVLSRELSKFGTRFEIIQDKDFYTLKPISVLKRNNNKIKKNQ